MSKKTIDDIRYQLWVPITMHGLTIIHPLFFAPVLRIKMLVIIEEFRMRETIV